jgi:hypothetical protein
MPYKCRTSIDKVSFFQAISNKKSHPFGVALFDGCNSLLYGSYFFSCLIQGIGSSSFCSFDYSLDAVSLCLSNAV